MHRATAIPHLSRMKAKLSHQFSSTGDQKCKFDKEVTSASLTISVYVEGSQEVKDYLRNPRRYFSPSSPPHAKVLIFFIVNSVTSPRRDNEKEVTACNAN